MPIIFNCKSCPGQHLSPIQLGSEANFQSAQISNNRMQCARTTQIEAYDKKDMRWADPIPSAFYAIHGVPSCDCGNEGNGELWVVVQGGLGCLVCGRPHSLRPVN